MIILQSPPRNGPASRSVVSILKYTGRSPSKHIRFVVVGGLAVFLRHIHAVFPFALGEP